MKFAARNGKRLERSDPKKHSINDLTRIPESYPPCAEDCLKPFLLTLRAAFISGNDYERLVNACEKLHKVYECMNRIKKCQLNYLFHILMDGFVFMCIEHPAAFRDLMECVDLHGQTVTKNCEQKCKAHKFMAGWFIYSIMQSKTLLRTDENGAPPRVNINFFRKITSEACLIGQCYFLCLKTKYNTRCHGVGGNLLMEVLVRPIYRIHNSILLSPFWNLIRLMMPSQCNFMMSDVGISKQRINPKLEKYLKDFYKNWTGPLIKFRPPLWNLTKHRKALLQKRIKRTEEGIDKQTLKTAKSEKKTNDNKRYTIGKDYIGDTSIECDKDHDKTSRRCRKTYDDLQPSNEL